MVIRSPWITRRLIDLGARQFGHVDRADRIAFQPFAHTLGLFVPLRVQMRIAVPVHGVEMHTLARGRTFAVADQQQVGRPFGRRIDRLAEFLGHNRPFSFHV